jgi:hypothetical protein
MSDICSRTDLPHIPSKEHKSTKYGQVAIVILKYGVLECNFCVVKRKPDVSEVYIIPVFRVEA